MLYRKDIQILRGIAVLLVVLFHLEIVGFKSGFLGVDVFFVISGYLMGEMYDPRRKHDFFVKRARRLLPAYFACVIVTLLVTIAMTTPNDYAQVAAQAWFATFFAPNIGYWLQNSYFAKAAFVPLLHLWSLGVEIQFYLLLPVLVWAFNKWKPAYLVLLVGTALACFFMVSLSPKTAFFWMPLRLWEFLLGFGVSRYIYKEGIVRNESLRWVGMAALAVIVAIPFMRIDGKAQSFVHGHPALIALLITLATAVVVAFGIPRRIEANLISTGLEKLGHASYSIYLAHYPVIVLFLYQPFAGTVLEASSLGQTALLAVLVVVGSTLLYKLVEQPFRHAGQDLRWMMAPAVVVLAISVAGPPIQRSFIPEKEMLIYQAWFDRTEYRCGKVRRFLNPFAVSCEITQPVENPTHRVLLVGNSFADSIKTTFSSVAEARNVSVYFMVDNRPLMSGGPTPEEVIREAQARNADAIVMHSSRNGVDARAVDQVARLASDRNIEFSLMLPPPTWEEIVPLMLWRNEKGIAALPSKSLEDYQSSLRGLIDGVTRIHYPNFKVYGTAQAFCRSDCRMASQSGKPFYFDGGHLTLTGSEELRGVIERVIEDLS
jgi:peptidoglycan/LPS O-acetylase OafA/YrhL